jgi:hypothetical protein
MSHGTESRPGPLPPPEAPAAAVLAHRPVAL